MKMLINVYTIEIVKNLNDLVIAANARSYINIEGYVIVTGYKIDPRNCHREAKSDCERVSRSCLSTVRHTSGTNTSRPCILSCNFAYISRLKACFQ